MRKGSLNFKQITKNTDHFDLEGMISPTFVNNGNTTVRVLFQEIPPKGQFAFNFPPLILTGSIPVTFLSGEGKNLVNVYFGAEFGNEEKKCN